MANSKRDNQSAQFAVYCGRGVYVHSIAHGTRTSSLNTGGHEGALKASRSVAIAALHIARKAGVNAWLVQHPSSFVGGASCL